MFLLSVSFSNDLSTLAFVKFLRARKETQGDLKIGGCPALERDDLCASGARCERQLSASPTLRKCTQ